MNKAVILLGSNIGDSHDYLIQALQFIADYAGNIVAQSGIYQTEPWGNTNQASFLNQLIILETELSPENLMEELLRIENQMGRLRVTKWEPRIIDLDIIYFNDWIINSDLLTIPHPLMQERKFVLAPLAQVLPDFIHPLLGKNSMNLLSNCSDDSEIRLLKADGNT
jgi:2-amino-4-hydroxy-6-hydroxymethyldihydropteridine diphosphokinase